MTDSERGEAIRRRRLAQGFRSLRQFAEKSGLSREAITAAEAGKARADTYQRLEAFLDAWEHEVGEDIPVRPLGTEGHYVEVELFKGNVRAIVKAHGLDPEELRAAISNILAGIPVDDDPEDDSEG